MTAPQPPAPRLPIGPPRTSRRRLLADRGGRWVIVAGGMGIIASILAILVFILVEVLPLARAAALRTESTVPFPHRALAVVGDEYRTHLAALTEEGEIRVVRLADGSEAARVALLAPAWGDGEAPPARITAAVVPPGSSLLVAATDDGRVLVTAVDWRVTFDERQRREVAPEIGAPTAIPLDPAGRPLGAFAAARGSDGSLFVAGQRADGRLALATLARSENLFTGEVEESLALVEAEAPGELTSLLVDSEGRNLFAGRPTGDLVWWRIEGGAPRTPEVTPAGAAAVTALTFLIGERSLVVGQEDGALSVWFPTRDRDDHLRLTRVRDLPPFPGAVRTLVPSQRNRTFLAKDDSGRLGLFFSTADRVLWSGPSPLPGATAATFSPKADGAFLAGDGRLAALAIANPHPEVTLDVLFGRIWYEGYARPEFLWQSTGGTDDFEAKLSLTPLLLGTLKGTFYSLLLAIPLGVLGGMYASQFMHPRILRVVKPTVEIMAALPSVVLGFLAGLWLAPRVEAGFPGLILACLAVPLAVLAAGAAWRALPARLRNRWPAGSEVGLYFAVVAAVLAGCFAFSDRFAALAFGGDFQAWLQAATGLTYDQRNAIVVGLAMGFAVIPIIFAISEDAFSNVPRNLVAGSLALGANRWQTVTRVVLPTASPGIFSAIMIGFGRAVGETMIVLMATGNTPVMSWSAFNGFRTLSANIAVEIPEAPHGSTLYRTLFLAALLLFAMTFLVNTLAELVRQRLRERYSRL